MNKLGFGFLRLPQVEENGAKRTDDAKLIQLVDAFLAKGGRYFDTAYTYLDGESERALKRTLVDRVPRGRYLLADKLPTWKVTDPADMERYLQEMLSRTGVTYYDVLLLHWLNPRIYEIAEKYGEFAFLAEKKAQGLAKEIGFSYHGDAALLEKILTEHPEVDVVQLQINYLDWEDPGIQARLCYETATRFGKRVVVMEPVKGGTLATLPEEATKLMKGYAQEASLASWAIRFAESLENVWVTLSGMNSMEQMEDNLSPHEPMDDEERRILDKVCGILNRTIAIPCTGCGYCVKGCPKQIPIPEIFRLYNGWSRNPKDDWKIAPAYQSLTRNRGKASDCIDCKQCENSCPQSIEITAWMQKAAGALEN